MEVRRPGIEPGLVAWEATVLPLDQRRARVTRAPRLTDGSGSLASGARCTPRYCTPSLERSASGPRPESTLRPFVIGVETGRTSRTTHSTGVISLQRPYDGSMTQASPLLEETNVDLLLSESELEARREHIVGFIADTVEDAGAEGAVIGLSGGIDSTTTAHLAVEALGSDAVHGLLMPSEVNADADETDAERVAEDLGIEYDVVDINPVVESFVDAAPEGVADDRMALGNVRVRTRAVLNYFVANAEDRVVLGTGNRSEAATGYFTKYGDQAVDCNPIGNLYKRQVRQLARQLGVPEDLDRKSVV